jgi:hypothetical protein
MASVGNPQGKERREWGEDAQRKENSLKRWRPRRQGYRERGMKEQWDPACTYAESAVHMCGHACTYAYAIAHICVALTLKNPHQPGHDSTIVHHYLPPTPLGCPSVLLPGPSEEWARQRGPSSGEVAHRVVHLFALPLDKSLECGGCRLSADAHHSESRAPELCCQLRKVWECHSAGSTPDTPRIEFN